MVLYCDEHQVPLDRDGRCVTTRDGGPPAWHRPDPIDTYEGPSLLARAIAQANQDRAALKDSLRRPR